MATTKTILQDLKHYESRNVTFMEADGSWPIVWERAKGVHVWDAEGKKYLDLTGAFGVAAAGHSNPNVVKAGQLQMGKLLHAMGDVHPHALKAQLARELSRITYERWSDGELSGKTIFCNSGFEAVESALKTAMIRGGKYGVVAFQGAYHGLGYGALNVTHRELFKSPFRLQLREFANFVPFPVKPSDLAVVETLINRLFQRGWVGAILVEPIQARGGTNVPPPGFLSLLRKLCDRHGALLIVDEIYTGFGRTGKWFACEHSEVIPDLICLGKALTGGFPLSACVGRADLMDAAWPASTGEAIHTSTFLGHPVGCAMALAQIAEIGRLKLADRSAQLGEYLLKLLEAEIPNLKYRVTIRGSGLMVGVELHQPDGKPATQTALNAIKAMLHRGYIMLPEGEHANIISFTPPLTITKAQLTQAVTELKKVLTAA
ncbi:MAG TPA: aspartate aminotransferase family protein [Verrucomicrobiae bacterium]|nr:aspartate aminotransferase family protein [Verrucomicrobiae bacterium]